MFLSEENLATILVLAIIIATKYLSEWDLALKVAAARRAAVPLLEGRTLSRPILNSFRTAHSCGGLQRSEERETDLVVEAVNDRRCLPVA